MTNLGDVSPIRTQAEAVAAEVRAEIARQRRDHAEVYCTLGISRRAWSRRLSGEVPFDVGELMKVAEILGVPADRLLRAAAHVADSASAVNQ